MSTKLTLLLLLIIAHFCLCSLTIPEHSDISKTLRDEKEDNATVSFKLFDLYDNEMATYVRAKVGDSDIDRYLLLDISSYMTIVYNTETINATNKINYRGESYECDITTDSVSTFGYHGSYDTDEPDELEYTIEIEVAHINLDP